MIRFCGQWHVQCHEVGLRKHLIEILKQIDLKRSCPARRQIGIVGNRAHPERYGSPCDLRPNPTHPKDTYCLAVKFDALVALSIPLARFHTGMRLGNVPRDRNQEREGMLGCGDRIAPRGVHYNHAATRCCVYIHIVDAHSCPADSL
jgi:hypothetical protein